MAAAMPANPISPMPRRPLVDLFVGIIQEMHFDRRRVGVHRYDVVRQTAINRCAILGIVCGVLQQRHADAHYYRALDLIAAGERIDNLAGIDDGDYAADAQTRDFRLPGDFGKVAPKRVSREFRLRIAERRRSTARCRSPADVGALQQIGERNTVCAVVIL